MSLSSPSYLEARVGAIGRQLESVEREVLALSCDSADAIDVSRSPSTQQNKKLPNTMTARRKSEQRASVKKENNCRRNVFHISGADEKNADCGRRKQQRFCRSAHRLCSRMCSGKNKKQGGSIEFLFRGGTPPARTHARTRTRRRNWFQKVATRARAGLRTSAGAGRRDGGCFGR